MKIYFYVFKFHSLRFLTYPLEMFSLVIRRLFEVIFLIYFWCVITNKHFYEIKSLVAYFLISGGINFIVMARRSELGKFLRKSIMHGEFNIYLIRPINIIPYLYTKTLGEISLTIIISIIFIVIGIIINPPQTGQLLIFPILFLIAILISLTFNVFEGILAFYITKASNITNNLRRATEVLSGSLVPLYLFPGSLEKIVKFTPFPSMIYGATSILTENLNKQDILFLVVVGLFWAVLLNILILYAWEQSLKHYEAIGI